jgi:hAT family C-terminal dimerisation region
LNASATIKRIKEFLKKSYPAVKTLPSQSISKPKKKSLEYELLEEYATIVSEDNDIDRYFDLATVVCVLKEKEDQTKWLLNWWAGNVTEYPRMAAAARDFLLIPALEVDIEALFSLGRDILGIRRYLLSLESIRALIILKDFLRRQEASQF